MRFLLLFLTFFCLSAAGFSQVGTVSGTVTSVSDGETLLGVSVMVKGTTNGTVTDLDGKYTISGIGTNAVLEFSYVGYEKLEIPVSGRSVVDVAMSAGNILTEVVVTSFGIAKDKKVLGYGSQIIKAAELMESSQPNVVNALQGRMAGVTINNSGGAPGSGASIIIRGINSLGGSDNQPLIVIDGIIISNATQSGNVLPSAGTNAINSGEQFMNSNRLGDVNMEDIENLNVLKGAAATALYGQRASNGAIIITTKKGKEGKTSVNYSYSLGLQDVVKAPEIQTTFYQGLSGIQRAAPATVFWQYGPPALPTDQTYNPFIDFFKTGVSNNHSLSFAGGSKNTIFQSSFSYLNNDGIAPNSSFKRTTARISANQIISSKFEVGGQMNYTNAVNVSPTTGDKSIYSSLWFWSPSFDVNDYLNPNGTQKNPFAGIIDNPRYLAENSALNSNVNRVFGDINMTYKFNSWLQAKYQITSDFYVDARSRIVGADLDAGSQTGGFVLEQSLSSKEINSNFLLTANKKLSNDFSVYTTLGNNITNIRNNSIGARGERFVAPGFLNILNTTNQFTLKDGSLRRLVGIFADTRIDYKDYLFLSLTGRNDWSSTLPANNRSFFYPSASLSYIVTNSILKENDVVGYMKLRGSLARVGKDAQPYGIGNYFSPVPGFPFGAVGGFTRDNNVGNFNLLPEITTESEVGIETSLFNNLISLEANYFTRNSKNQILRVPISTATGYSSYTTNAGVINNRGVELLLGIKPLTGAFKWDIDVNWTRIRGRVESMPADLQEISYVTALGGRAVLRVQEGGAVGDLFGYDWRRNANGETLIGANGLPTLETAKYIKAGNALPDWLGGVNNSFSYRGISLSALLEWRHGGDVVDLGENNGIRNGTLAFTEDRNKAVVWKGVLADGTQNTLPVTLDENTYRAFGINGHYSYVIQDASWFRVRNINFSYSIPRRFIGKAFSSLRIGATGNNLFLSTPFRGYDPEALAFGSGTNLVGFTGRNTPNTRNYNFNVNVGF